MNKKLKQFYKYVDELKSKYNYCDFEANKPILFIENNLRFRQGPKTGQKVVLPDWQKDLIRAIFGLFTSDGKRLIEECYIQLPRGNAKSFIAATLAIYNLLFGPAGGETLLAANSREQAKEILYKDCYLMCKQADSLSKFLKIEKHKIENIENGSLIRSISRDVGTAQGGRTSLCIIDELHELKNRDFFDVLLTSFGKIPNGLVIEITTSGDDLNSFCYQQYAYSQKILDRAINNDHFLPFICEADEDVLWDSEEALYQANINAGISIEKEKLLAELQKARELPTEKNKYCRYRLNQWIYKKDEKWIDMAKFLDCKLDYKDSDLIGQDCYLGIDLSSNIDLTCLSLVFPGDPISTLTYTFMPSAGLKEKERIDKIRYSDFLENGHLYLCTGNTIDYDQIKDFIFKLLKRYNVKQIIYDKWNCQMIIKEIEQSGYNNCIDFIQTTNYYHPVCVQFENLYLNKKIAHDGNPILLYCASCVEINRDQAGKMRPVKKQDDKSAGYSYRIDAIISLLMALDGHLRSLGQQPQTSQADFYSKWGKCPANLRSLLGV